MSTNEPDRSAEPRDEAGDQTHEGIVATDAVVASPSDDAGQAPRTDVAAAPSAEEVEGLRRERDELRDALLRRRAEFENFRRRMERERQAWSADAEAAIVGELVPTLDNLEQALKTDSEEKGLRDGLELIQRELLATLARLGLGLHDPVGRPFDPLTDQALLYEETPDAAEGTVIATFRKGYLFKDRLLRPAMVKVAKAATAAGQTETTGGPDAGSASRTAPNEVD